MAYPAGPDDVDDVRWAQRTAARRRASARGAGRVPVVRITQADGSVAIINRSDFDPDVHLLAEGERKPRSKKHRATQRGGNLVESWVKPALAELLRQHRARLQRFIQHAAEIEAHAAAKKNHPRRRRATQAIAAARRALDAYEAADLARTSRELERYLADPDLVGGFAFDLSPTDRQVSTGDTVVDLVLRNPRRFGVSGAIERARRGGQGTRDTRRKARQVHRARAEVIWHRKPTAGALSVAAWVKSECGKNADPPHKCSAVNTIRGHISDLNPSKSAR